MSIDVMDASEAPAKVDRDLTGKYVTVLTDDGAVHRGRRRWKPGRTVGVVRSKHKLHTRAWNVEVRGAMFILFTDELDVVALQTKESLTA